MPPGSLAVPQCVVNVQVLGVNSPWFDEDGLMDCLPNPSKPKCVTATPCVAFAAARLGTVCLLALTSTAAACL